MVTSVSDKGVPAEGLVGLCCSGRSALSALVKERRPQGQPGPWQHVGPSGPGGGVGAWSPWAL